MLTQNSELRKDGIHNWTLPAWVVRDSHGVAHNVCPSAGACVKFCYARNGTYLFRNVKAAHVRNLERVQTDLNGWTTDMLNELRLPRFRPKGTPRLPDLPRDHLTEPIRDLLDGGCAAVRIHDSGGFFNDEYLLAWFLIAAHTPWVLFYAYTKEVDRFRRLGFDAPDNFLWCFSMGGQQDHLIDKDRDRHADVFPDLDAVEAAGYYSQHANDLLCVVAPSNRVGIPANNIKHLRKAQGAETFASLEAATRRTR